MFKYFNITNGILTPEFKGDILTYNVKVDENTTELELDFEMEVGTNINVVGNNSFSTGDNYVFIELVKDDILTTYTLIVNKEKSQTVLYNINDSIALETNDNNSMPFVISPVFIFIFVLFIYLFFRIFLKKA